MRNDIREWVIKWFVENSDINEKDIRNSLEENYLLMGFIDSFKFIELVEEAEEEYDIEFDNTQFEDRSFSSINGFATIISKLIDEKD